MLNHVYPDWGRPHDTDGTTCWCLPRVEWEFGVVIHRCPDCNELTCVCEEDFGEFIAWGK